MKKNITIIDYGSGNILSAKQSFARVIKTENIDADVCISGNPKTIINSTHIVLPGQGAFETCINGLKRIPGMIEELNNFVDIKTRLDSLSTTEKPVEFAKILQENKSINFNSIRKL